MGRSVELVACEDCGNTFERPFGRGWMTRCLDCWVKAKIAAKHERNCRLGPTVSKPVVTRGSLYVEIDCNCKTPPWEVCQHSDV